jgi:GntR family transcriptional regulator, transcriptional repressor for pyruvate dehydrogenase complex
MSLWSYQLTTIPRSDTISSTVHDLSRRVDRVDPRPQRESIDDDAQAWPRFAVVGRSTLPEEIANRVLELIRAQELRPGDKLPPERSLAAMMQVSRPVLREALRALAIMKVVEIRQGAGTYITALEPQQLVSHLDFVFSKDGVALAQLVEARRVVEVGNARLAAQRIGSAGLDELEAILAELEAEVDDPDRFSDLDIAFHNGLCAAAANFLLGQFMSIINTLAKVSRERTGALRPVREATLRDHHHILEALRARDPEAAAHAMEDHLDRVARALGPGQAGAAPPGGTPVGASPATGDPAR